MLAVTARDSAQETAFQALFDRAELYAEFMQSVKEARSTVKRSTEAELRKAMRALEQQLLNIQAGDFFPGLHSEKAAAALEALRRAVELHLSPGEPEAGAHAIRRLALADYQGKAWATRKRPWVDRLATAWLVQRFVDPAARFVWVDAAKKCPRGAIGFDFDGAPFSHVADKVTFEVVAQSFGLDDDPALQRLAELVHCIDVGGIPVDAAPGVETVVRGLQALHADDDALLAAALAVFDALYAAMRQPQ